MSELTKQLKTRIIHKHKTEAEWYLDVYDADGNLRDDPFTPYDGELIVFDPEKEGNQKRFKFGDGKTNVVDLPFTEKADEIYVGDGDMPENATIQIILDGEDEPGESIDSAISEHNVDTTAHTDIRAQISKLSSEKVDKIGISLGVAPDGLIYVFINGQPVGTGISQGQSGDVTGYVDENNTIVLNGELADGTYAIKYVMESGEMINIGNLVLDANVYYTVTKNLTNCTTNNTATKIVEGKPYTATISANDGYELKSVTVTMGDSPVTVTNGVISIASVTGNIVITAVAEEVVVAEPTNFADPESGDWKVDCRLTTNINMTTPLTGGVATNYISVQNGDIVTCEGINFENDNNRIAHSDGADGEAIGGIARASIYATTYVNNGFFKDVTYDANSITLTITCPTTTMRFSGLATGTSNDVVVNIKRNGEWL